ncbi:MAG: hypothetical protein VX278_21285, partial [Myxococcota bacterium]|nr:hypothetical protein [Myxococcota bacterium]
RNAILRLRSQLVPFEIPLELPEEPYSEEKLHLYQKKVEIQRGYGQKARDLNDWGRTFGIGSFGFKQPYGEETFTAAIEIQTQQQALMERLHPLLVRAKAIRFTPAEIPKPLSSEWIESFGHLLHEQEEFSIEFSLLVAKIKEFELPIEIPPLPINNAIVRELESRVENEIAHLSEQENAVAIEATEEVSQILEEPHKAASNRVLPLLIGFLLMALLIALVVLASGGV